MASLLRPSILRQVCATSARRTIPSSITASPFKTSRPLQSAFVRNALPGSARVAAFHASSRLAILPPLPQRIEGTVNEAVPVHDPTPMHGSYHWSFERAIAVGLIPLTLSPFAAGSLNPALDATLCTLILLHSHVGFQSIIIDYVPQHRLPRARKYLMWLLNLATLLVGIGLYEFETNDVGLTEAIRRIWRAGSVIRELQ